MRTTRLACLVATLALSASGLRAQGLVVTDDTYVIVADGARFGASEKLAVRGGPTGPAAHTYLRFALDPLAPGTSIQKATLRLFASRVVQPGPLVGSLVLDPWTEATLEGTNEPRSASSFNFAVGFADESHYVLVDVTGAVTQWLAGSLANNGLVISAVDPDPVSVVFDSKENKATSHPAEIEIVLAPIPGPQGAQGPQGPPGPPGPQGPPVDLSGVLSRLSSLETRVTALENHGGGGGNGLRPVAPSATQFMWQGQQRALRGPSGACQASIALGVGDQATCFTATDGSLRCAGQVYTQSFGPSFVPVPGRTGVDQVLMSLTANSTVGNGMCVHQADGTAWCMGNFNNWGQFGNGTNQPSTSFTRWGSGVLSAIGTGTWDQICALDTSGNVSCAGNSYGFTPVLQGGPGPHSKLWVTPFGTAAIDDSTVLRAAEGRTECTVQATGLVCGPGGPAGQTLGAPGTVVMGGFVRALPDAPFPGPPPPPPGPGCQLSQPVCWLDNTGTVSCGSCTPSGLQTKTYFASGSVVAISLSFYGNNVCAVYGDGSLWCMGSNTNGMLGTGDTAPRTAATMVQPPGSVQVSCH